MQYYHSFSLYWIVREAWYIMQREGQGETLQWTGILSRESSNAPVVFASYHRNWDFVEQIMLSFHMGFVHIRNVQHQIFSLKAAIKKLLKLLSFLSNFVQASIQFLCVTWSKLRSVMYRITLMVQCHLITIQDKAGMLICWGI